MNSTIDSVRSLFVEQFQAEPVIYRSPGRVNLIGEHTDYNDGFVLPAAINKEIYFAIRKRDDRQCNLYAADLHKSYSFQLDNFYKSDYSWPNYLLGVVYEIILAGHNIGGFDCAFGGNIPIGAGLSSSAAIEAGLAYALKHTFELDISDIDLVKLAQKAENEFVGVRCGIMDQYINIFGKDKTVLQIDCRSLDYEYYPFSFDNIAIILCDTQVKHSLASTAYNKRREQCETGVAKLAWFDEKIKALRDVTPEFLEEHKAELDDEVYRRCKYVVGENKRLLDACEDLKNNDLEAFGKKMYETHYGLSKDYEVSCKELDELVDIAQKHEAVVGARMMGGGFGGCTINLVYKDKVDDFKEFISVQYRNNLNRDIKIYEAEIVSGTSVVQ